MNLPMIFGKAMDLARKAAGGSSLFLKSWSAEG